MSKSCFLCLAILLACASRYSRSCMPLWPEAGSTDINCSTTGTIAIYVHTNSRQKSTLIDLFLKCIDLDTQETEEVDLNTEPIRDILNEGENLNTSIDFLANSSIANATNVTCLLYGCSEIDENHDLRNFPNATVHCPIAEIEGPPIELSASPSEVLSSTAPTLGPSFSTTVTLPTRTQEGHTPKGEYYIMFLALPAIALTTVLLVGMYFYAKKHRKRRRTRAIRLGMTMQQDDIDYDYTPVDINTRLTVRHSESSETITDMLDMSTSESEPLVNNSNEPSASNSNRGVLVFQESGGYIHKQAQEGDTLVNEHCDDDRIPFHVDDDESCLYILDGPFATEDTSVSHAATIYTNDDVEVPSQIHLERSADSSVEYVPNSFMRGPEGVEPRPVPPTNTDQEEMILDLDAAVLKEINMPDSYYMTDSEGYIR